MYGCIEELMAVLMILFKENLRKGKLLQVFCLRDRFVDYAMHRVKMLRHYGVIPYLVFDGDRLPSKGDTEAKRRERRREQRALGDKFQALGNRKGAMECYQKCVDITPLMAYRLIQALRRENVSYIVAPYEADAQLVYLEQNGIICGVISEDSDLLVFGCQTLFVKMDAYGGCTEIKREKFGMVKSPVALASFDHDMFRHMAILSGCDYLDSIPNVGLKTAYKYLNKHRTVERALTFLKLEKACKVPEDYLDNFRLAEAAFLYQRVFCPLTRRIITFSPLINPDDGILAIIGDEIEDSVALEIARGNIDPISRKEFQSNKENMVVCVFLYVILTL
jgi:exonuclease-1